MREYRENVMPTADEHPPRPLGRSVLLGSAVGIGVALTAFLLISIPFYTLASFEPNGMDRPLIRTGLLQIALPVGLALGAVTGVVTGRWLRRGGSWTVDDGGDRYSNR